MACAPACFPASSALASCSAASSSGQSLPMKDMPTPVADQYSLPVLSARGAEQATKVTPFWATFDKMLSDSYNREHNPSGFVNMGVANNYTMERELLEYFHSHLQLDDVDLTYGSSLFGSVRLFKALCQHYNRAFQPHMPLQPQHIITGPGAGPLLDQLFEHLADPHDGVLCAAPYYNGFDADLATRALVKCIPVYSTACDGSSAPEFEGTSALRGFEAALEKSHSAGTLIKAVLLCNPNNPVGRAYDRDALVEYGRFCEKHNLHLVVDEIYALSVFPTKDVPQPQPFISAISIDWAAHGIQPARVHIVSSASKDFGINGFRVGWVISQYNTDLLSAMKLTSKLYMIGAPSDALFSALLSDTAYLQTFVRTNRTRLSRAYELARSWCLFHGVPYTPSNACHFFLVDFSRWTDELVEKSLTTTGRRITPAEAETALWAKALSQKLCITPGSNYHHPRVGVFRLTFSHSRDAALEGFARLERALGLPAWTPPSEAQQYDPMNDAKAIPALEFVTSDKDAGRAPQGAPIEPEHPGALKPQQTVPPAPFCTVTSALTACSLTSKDDPKHEDGVFNVAELEQLRRMASACRACSC